MTAPVQAMRADQAEQARLWLGAVERGEISRAAAAIGQLHGARAPAQFSYLERAADADLAQAVCGEDCRVMALLDGAREVDFSKVKALGNSMAVPVMRWIGQRIDMVRAVLAQQAENACNAAIAPALAQRSGDSPAEDAAPACEAKQP